MAFPPDSFLCQHPVHSHPRPTTEFWSYGNMSVSQGRALTAVALCTVRPLSLAALHQAALTTADPSSRHDSPLLFQTPILTPSHISFGLSDADTHTSLFSRKLFLTCWWWLNSGLQQLWNHLHSLFLVCTNYVLQKYLHVTFHCFIAKNVSLDILQSPWICYMGIS